VKVRWCSARSVEYRLQVRRWDDSTGSSPGEVASSLHTTGLCISLPDGRLASLKIISPDGKWFGHFDDGLQIWRFPRDLSLPAEDSILMPPNPERERSESRAVLDPDGSTVWSTSNSTNEIRAWDVVKDRPSSIHLRHDPNPTQVVVSASGLIATIPDNHGIEPVEVHVKNKWTGEATCPPIAQGNRVLGMAFSPDGKLLAAGGLIHAAGLWEMPSGRRSGAPLPTHNIILDLKFSPDGRSLAAGCWEGQLYVWDVGTRTLKFPPLPHGEHLARVLFSPDGALLIASTASAAHLWDARTGRKLHTLRFHRPAAVGRVFRDVQQLLSPDGSILLTSSGSGSFQLWQVADGKPPGPQTPSGKAEWACFAFSPDGRIVASGHEDGSTRLWDVTTTRPIAAATKQSCPVVGVIFSPDGREYSTFALDGTVRRWPISTPLERDVDRIAKSVMLATGLRMDATAGVIPLTRIEWEDLHRDWIRAETNADWSISAPIPDADWHDARAHDAEQTGHHRTALWHLDRLLEARSNDWRAFLRRSRIRALEGRKSEAEADYRSASSLISPETVESYWNYHQSEARPVGSR
jgi:WD40 repeat protein